MKASEVTKDGYYWTCSGGEWHIVQFSEGCFHYGDGSGESIERLHHDYEVIGPLDPPKATKPLGCRAKLAPDQWWAFCGETDMGQSLPALCTECGGDLKRAE